jgi:predicted ribosomally synthesized six-cysteine peptide SCIFF
MTEVFTRKDGVFMKHIKILNNANLKKSAVKGGCGECQASCQSACKTSCTVANQKCEKNA